jgi:hypothetical protein
MPKALLLSGIDADVYQDPTDRGDRRSHQWQALPGLQGCLRPGVIVIKLLLFCRSVNDEESIF